MSEIRDPAHPDSPTAPGDEGQSQQSSATDTQQPAQQGAAEPGNDAAHASPEPDSDAQPAAEPSQPLQQAQHGGDDGDDDGPAPGNEAPAGARAAQDDEEESPEDSIGNRIDGPPTGASQAGQTQGAPGTGKRKRRRGGEKGGAPGQPGGGGERGPRPAHAGGGGGAGGDPNARRAFHVGDKVRAKVVSIGPAAAVVDLWGKEHGVLDLRELTTPDAPVAQPGDGVDVVVIQDGARGGNLVVTRDPNRAERAREMVAQAFNSNEPIEGLITGVNRGGLEVDLSGVRAFCPSSQIDVRFPPTVNPKSLVLTRQTFKITSLLEDGREAIVSRRALLEQAVRARAEEAKASMKVGAVVKGTVVAVKDYGVFVDLGGIEGWIHVSELTHNRSARPSDVCKVGDTIEAKVLKISSGGPKPEQGGGGGEKQGRGGSQHPPAQQQDASSAEGGTHAEGAEGPGGAAEAEGGADEPHGDEGAAATQAEGGDAAATDGSAPAATEGAAAGGATGAAEKKPGDKKDRDKDKKKHQRRAQPIENLPRVILSRRAVEPDPWEGIEKRYAIGSVHPGKVVRMQPFGAFVELEPGIDGLLHVSELGAGKRIEHPQEVLKQDQAVNVRVERVDRSGKRISLSLLPEGVTEAQLKSAVVPRVGMVVKAKVVEHDSIGVWAQIEGAIGKFGRGLIPPPESAQPRGTDLRKAIPIGTEVQVKVIEMDRGRPKLSIKAALHDEERQAYRAYQKEATSKTVGVSLADKLRAKLGGLGGGQSGR